MCNSRLYKRQVSRVSFHIFPVGKVLDDQTQVDSKLAGQPEHASLNQCQLVAAMMLWAPPAGGGDKVSL